MTGLLSLPMFAGFTEAELAGALSALSATKRRYVRGELIFTEGQLTDTLGIILTGSVTIERVDYTGSKLILAVNTRGHIFAEVYALTHHPLQIDVAANEDCEILFLNMRSLDAQNKAEHPWLLRLTMNLLRISSQKNLALSARSFHTVSKTARGRVLAYLMDVAREQNAHEFDIPMDRQQLADYLNLDRSALSGELGRMRRDGLIEFRKNHFKLLTP